MSNPYNTAINIYYYQLNCPEVNGAPPSLIWMSSFTKVKMKWRTLTCNRISTLWFYTAGDIGVVLVAIQVVAVSYQARSK